MTARRAFGVLGIAAVGLVALLAVARIVVAGDDAASPEAMLPVLVSAAALCVVGLTASHYPTVAWLALIVALVTTTIDLATFGREQRALVAPETWRWIEIAIVVAALFATASAAAYAMEPVRRLGRWVAVLGAIAVGTVFLVGAWALANPDLPSSAIAGASPLGDLGVVTRAFLVSTTALTILGLLGDLRPAATRATRRLKVSAGLDGWRYGVAWVRALADELSPGRARERRAATSERARIARDLHAVVVPDLRRALRQAESGGSVDRLAASLRDALGEVEGMIETRDAIGLEIGGLVPALESLAERIEERSDVRVTIDVLDEPSAGTGSPPPEVEAAALRVATLALDNVTRHAPGATVRLSVAASSGSVRLSIEDDGRGLPGDVGSGPERGRGLTDMATEAALCGASIRSGRGERGIGTVIAFDWPRI